jgi:tetratricopeptide (TPR) repeat protein
MPSSAPASLKPESRPAGLSDRWTVVGVCFFLAAIIWVVFGQTFHYRFVNFDDNDYVYRNPVVQKGLTLRGIIWAFARVHCANWHPLTWISHMLDCQLYGLNPGGHHLSNVLLHTAAAILLFLVLRRMTGFLWRSAFVAAVFAIHPLHVESVAWVSERKDVLSGVFFMLTLWAYVRYVEKSEVQLGWGASRRPKSKVWYGLTLLFFAFGLMSKPMLVTLPFVLLLLDYWPLNRFGLSTLNSDESRAGPQLSTKRVLRLVLEKIPFFVLSAASCVATLFAQHEAIQSFEDMSVPLRVGNASISYVAYLGQMFWPRGLAVLYPLTARSVGVSGVVLSVVVLAGISTGVLVLRRRRPYLLTGWLWYLIMLVPVIGIIQVGVQARADRYTYLPQIGLYLLLTWGAAELCAGWRHRRVVLGGCATVILVALIFCARAQTAYWRNSESLWTHTLACNSDNYTAHNNLGDALLQKGNVDEAIVQYQKALQIYPDYAEAHYNLGCALLKKGNVDEAITQYQKALQITPDDAGVHNNLGNALLTKGNVDEAVAHFQQALQITPDFAEARYNLGNALLTKGNVDEAIVHYQRALQIEPDYAEAHNNLGNALLKKGSMDEAIVHYQKALQITPDFAEAHNNLGNALLKKGSVDEAITHFQQALQITPDYAEAHNNLGNALFQKGKMDEAIVQYQKALQITPDYAEALNNLARVLATCPQASLRNGNKAVELAQRANQLTGDGNPVVLDTLAAAYAEAGRFSEAIETATRALDLSVAQNNKPLAEVIQNQLKLFETHSPYHEKP